MHVRMPRPISWASPGGIAPREYSMSIDLNLGCLDRDTSQAEGDKQDQGEDNQQQPLHQPHHQQHQAVEDDQPPEEGGDQPGEGGDQPEGVGDQPEGGGDQTEEGGAQSEEGGDQPVQGEEHNHPLQHGHHLHQPEGGVQSCGTSMHEWMPGPISRGSPGGSSPIKESNVVTCH